jgi:ESS family glutamate:Na+ symporter
VLTFNLVQTLAFGGVVLFGGYGIRRLVPPIARYNIPAPVVGGLVVALLALAFDLRGVKLFTFDTTLQAPLMIAFFTTIGFGASVSLLKSGGPLVLVFLALATVAAVLQNVLGVAVAMGLGEHPLLGVLAGSVALTGGPATGLAFAPLFEQAGVGAAAAVAVAAAMGGIVTGGLVGNPLATLLIERHDLETPKVGVRLEHPPTAANIVEERIPEPAQPAPAGEDVEAFRLLKALVLILVAMWMGGWLSDWFTSVGITLPAYIGAMLIAAGLRNLDDWTGQLGIPHRVVDDLGSVALSLFLVLALMTLELYRLAGVAGALGVLIVAQVAAAGLMAYTLVYRLSGRDYEAAVISSGFIGFMLGTTANAMANMDALVGRFGPAPRAFLVVPMVGAFFIDFTNALIITVFLNTIG